MKSSNLSLIINARLRLCHTLPLFCYWQLLLHGFIQVFIDETYLKSNHIAGKLAFIMSKFPQIEVTAKQSKAKIASRGKTISRILPVTNTALQNLSTMKMIRCNFCIMTFKILEVKLVWESFSSSGNSHWFKKCLSYILKVYDQSQTSSSILLFGIKQQEIV